MANWSTKKQGFSTVEILLAIALFVTLVLALTSALAYGVEQQKQNSEEIKGNYLLEEGLEAVANINIQGFANLSTGAHGLTTNAGVWAFTGTSDLVDNYTRVITITTVDANTVDAVVSISWLSGLGRLRTLNGTERFTNYNRTIAVTGTWTAPIAASTTNINGLTGGGLAVTYSGTNAIMIKDSGNPDFAVVSFANPAAPVQSWSLNLPGNPLSMVVGGNAAFVATTTTGAEIQVVDLTTHAIIDTKDITGTANTTMKLYYLNNYLYVLRAGTNVNSNQLYIYNTTNPANITQTGTLSFPNGVSLYDIVVSGNYAYIATSADNGELAVVDVTSKNAPQFMVSLDLTGNADGHVLNILNNTVFLGRTGDANIYVINVGNPLIPTLTSSFNIGGVPASFTFGSPNNTYVYVASSNVNRDLQVINISNLSVLSVVGYLNTSVLNSVVYDPVANIVIGTSTNVNGEMMIFQSN
jgi:Tfp pilus assembly protein PilV